MLFGRRLKKRVIGLTGLAALGVIVHLLDSQRPKSIDLFDGVEERSSEPDYYAVKSHYRSYAADGSLQHAIKADRLLHYPDTLQTHLEKPELRTYGMERGVKNQALWNAKSLEAFVEGDGNHFQLNQNVIVWKGQTSQPETRTLTPIRITTDQLNIDLVTNKAYTSEQVLLETDQGRMQGKGLQADLKTSQVNLHEDVRGLYVQ